ncbi:MAG: prepilin-type N-terminal cleavage/methylation domain-containing protein [Patescibacteria group bacterium]
MSRHVPSAGFTLIEIIMVTAMIGMLTVATVPLSQRYLARGKMDAVVREFISSTRHAQTLAQTETDGEAWGVYVGSSLITVFQGDSFALRSVDYDQSTPYPASMTVTGTVEYDFTQRTGKTAAGTLTITGESGDVRVITVNEFGVVEY